MFSISTWNAGFVVPIPILLVVELTKSVFVSTVRFPVISTLSWNVETPETLTPPERTLRPVLAVAIPIESTFVTSSYVSTPVILALPLTVRPEAESVFPSNVRLEDPVGLLEPSLKTT